MESIAYELASTEVGMLMDCAVCNVVTAGTASEYKYRITSICAEAKADSEETDYAKLDALEQEAHAYIDTQVGRFDSIMSKDTSDDGAVYAAIASLPGVTRTACGFTVPGVHVVTLSKANNTRLRHVVEASADTRRAINVVKSMTEVTASSVRYELSTDSLSFIRSAVLGLGSDRTATTLRKAFGGLL